MLFSQIQHIFNNHSVSVAGIKGSGKDVLMGNVAVRNNKPYMSNCNYGGKYIPYSYNDIDLNTTFREMINGTPSYYEWKHPAGTDLYLSDCGTLFPAQYCNELNKEYPSLPLFIALQRQLTADEKTEGGKTHQNTQAYQRVWDKIREQSDYYITCQWLCKPLLKLTGIVIQSVIIYDKYESAVNRVKPCRIRVPLTLNPEARLQAEIYRDNFFNQHGNVEKHILVYINKSKHDTIFFKEFFKNGVKRNEKLSIKQKQHIHGN